MPITGKGWELHIQRLSVQRKDQKIRTVGTYTVFHDGVEQPNLSGGTAEPRGPGDDTQEGNDRRISQGSYPLEIHDTAKFSTVHYVVSDNFQRRPKPGIGVGGTMNRQGIVVHPGLGFLDSVGCINITGDLSEALYDIAFVDSRNRVIALIQDLLEFAHLDDHAQPGRIPNASLVVDGEPLE